MFVRYLGFALTTTALVAALLATLLPVTYESNIQVDRLLGSTSVCPRGCGTELLQREGPSRTACSGVHFFYNGHIWTGNPERPWAQALSVTASGSIASIGSNAAVLGWPTALRTWLVGPTDTATDLGGQFVMPGFVDAHVHLVSGGHGLSWVNLQGVTSKDDFVVLVQQAIDKLPNGTWVQGGLWAEQTWGGQLPSKAWIDAISPDHPVFLVRNCGHMALANSRALAMAGIGMDAVDPFDGQIRKDAAGEPTGILTENAMKLVGDLIPKPSAAEDLVAVYSAAKYLLSRGITTVHDMGRAFAPAANWGTMHDTYLAAADNGTLPIRIKAYLPLRSLNTTADFVAVHGRSHLGGRLFWGGLKEFSDGSLGSRTALMQEPYTDAPDTSGIAVMDYAELQDLMGQAHEHGLQLAVHAIGDKANADVAHMFDAILANSSVPSSVGRHRIEHAQHLEGVHSMRDMQRLGLTAVINPLHLLTDTEIMRERLGPERAGPERGFAYQAMLKAGVSIAAGSDWPVVPAEPLLGIYAAVHRKHPDAAQGWYAEEAGLTVEQAMREHTVDSAWVSHMEESVGSLREGLKADFVVLSANPLTAVGVPEVLQTYMDGGCVYNSNTVEVQQD